MCVDVLICCDDVSDSLERFLRLSIEATLSAVCNLVPAPDDLLVHVGGDTKQNSNYPAVDINQIPASNSVF